MKQTNETKCKERVYPAGAWHASQCTRGAVVNGYCRQHDPVARQAKRDANNVAWKAKYDAQVAAGRLRNLKAEFADECATWLGEGTAPLSPDALYTGAGDPDRTFGDVARALLASKAQGGKS